MALFSRLIQHLNRFSGRKVLVVGDLMVDHYLWGTVERISPEAPVPVVHVTSESTLPGGAANVLHNILTLGGSALLCGVVGADDAGRWLMKTLTERAGDCSGVVVDPDRLTIRKTRVVAHQQQVVRFDHEQRASLSPKIERQLSDQIARSAPDADVIVVSDYAKGAITPKVMNAIRAAAGKTPVIVDPKVPHLARYKKVSLMTPNHLEASLFSGIKIVDEKTLCRAGAALLRKAECSAVLITRGAAGMTLFEREKKPVHIPTEAQAVFDVTGAGDTVVSTLALAVAAGATWYDAARLANIAAGLAVESIGTTAISLAGLRARLS
jgi:D-beta-D-heptose 7-phosphate kinase/D-beta-D-heptose 1-phosphate adenosyltransferase